jgi:hypothetical protein
MRADRVGKRIKRKGERKEGREGGREGGREDKLGTWRKKGALRDKGNSGGGGAAEGG